MTQVLVVDDDEANREAMRLLLEYAGHMVGEAFCGTAALEALCTCPTPCVVVLDLLMGPLDGRGVLEAVLAERAAGRGKGKGDVGALGRHAFVVVTAAEQFHTQITALLDQIPAPLLRKPFNIDELTALVAEAAGRLEASAKRDGVVGAPFVEA